ncbi:MAG: transposase family protein [Bacilli bacterium]
MEKYEKLKKLSDKKFKRAIGITRLLFEIYILVITEALEIRHKKGGRKPKLSAEDILLLMLYYYRDYTTFFKLGLEFGIDESNSYRWVKWCEETLVEYSMELFDGSNMNLDNEYIVDVMECPVERPKNQELQREFYSGKKKKIQLKFK